MTCCDYCYSLDDGPIVFINECFECFFSPVFTSHIMMCRELLVPLTGGEVYVLDPLVLKLLEFGSLPECHTHFVHCGQVRAQRRPVEVRGGGGGGGGE